MGGVLASSGGLRMLGGWARRSLGEWNLASSVALEHRGTPEGVGLGVVCMWAPPTPIRALGEGEENGHVRGA